MCAALAVTMKACQKADARHLVTNPFDENYQHYLEFFSDISRPTTQFRTSFHSVLFHPLQVCVSCLVCLGIFQKPTLQIPVREFPMLLFLFIKSPFVTILDDRLKTRLATNFLKTHEKMVIKVEENIRPNDQNIFISYKIYNTQERSAKLVQTFYFPRMILRPAPMFCPAW